MIIHDVLNAIAIQLVHLNLYVIHIPALVYVKKTFMVHVVIDVLTVHFLYHLIIPKVVQNVIVSVPLPNVIRVHLIIE
jgi:hypothetical protein